MVIKIKENVDIDIQELYDDYMNNNEKMTLYSYLLEDYGIDNENFEDFFNKFSYDKKVEFIKNFVYFLKYTNTENLIKVLENEVK